MAIFISYSHKDKDIADRLAKDFVRKNAQVWIDSWELNVGDSILSKIQDAITYADAILVLLSQSSVESQWCKKELDSGLLRELEEKKVFVLPVLIEDCQIPLFLRGKKYADLREDYESGFQEILQSISAVTNPNQSRLPDDGGFVDWSMDWGYLENLFFVRYTIVQVDNINNLSFLTDIRVICNENLTKRQEQFLKAGIGWLGRSVIAEALFDASEKSDFRYLLDDTRPKNDSFYIDDPKTGAGYRVEIECRKLGEDNGKNQILDVGEYITRIREYVRAVSRDPSREELLEFARIAASPFPA